MKNIVKQFHNFFVSILINQTTFNFLTAQLLFLSYFKYFFILIFMEIVSIKLRWLKCQCIFKHLLLLKILTIYGVVSIRELQNTVSGLICKCSI